jgi:hypothetical protein
MFLQARGETIGAICVAADHCVGNLDAPVAALCNGRQQIVRTAIPVFPEHFPGECLAANFQVFDTHALFLDFAFRQPFDDMLPDRHDRAIGMMGEVARNPLAPTVKSDEVACILRMLPAISFPRKNALAKRRSLPAPSL